MSVIDISNIQYKLIGVCALKGKERELLKSLWTERFSGQVAFFTEVESSDRALIITRKVFQAISDAGYKAANGFQVALAVFVDLTEAMDEAFLKELSQVATQLNTHLKCSVKIQLFFGYVGMAGLNEGEDVELMRQNAKALVSSNPYAKGVYLVAEPAFGGTPEFRWKAVNLLLDMVRREANLHRLQSTSHDNGTIGFLRYGEYDEQMLVKLKNEEKQLVDHLGSHGNVEFPGVLSARLANIEAAAREHFVVDPNMQPIHPDMIVSGFMKIWSAKRNSNDEFNRGRAQTLAALQGTGEGLVTQIQEFYQSRLGDARQFLVQMLTDIHAGIVFVENRMLLRSLLSPQIPMVRDAMPPALTYNENGYADEVRNYLEQKLQYGIYKAKVWFCEALQEAFDNFSEKKIAQCRGEMQEQLRTVQNNMKHVPTKQEFCDQAIGFGGGLDAQFMAIVGAGGDLTIKYLVCRKEEDKLWIEQNCFMGNQQEARFYIHETMGGLINRDEAPIKALQLLMFDCTESRLQELLGM